MKRDFEGGRWIVEMRPRGAGRYVMAVVLMVWLAGWGTGEAFAISMLGRAWIAAPGPTNPIETAFLAVWLAGWTLGGLLALYQVLRHLIGHDRIEYDGAGLRRLSGLGPFLGGRAIRRDELQGIAITRQGLVARTGARTIVLTRFGTREEQGELMQHLRQELHLDAGVTDAVGATPDALPDGWESLVAPDQSITLRRKRGPLNPLRHEFRLQPGRVEESIGMGNHQRRRSLDNPDLAIESWIAEEDLIYRLIVRHVGGKTEVAQTIDDPFELVQLGRWMSRRIERPLELPRELRERFAA